METVPLLALACAAFVAPDARLLAVAPTQNPAPQVREEHARYGPREVEALIRESARKNKLPEARVVHIAWRESKFIPNVRSRGGRYVGIYQFDLTTWRNTPEGRAGRRREDPVANINAAHWLMRTHGFSPWAVGGAKKKRRGRH